jgi:ribosomal protein S18 acetylase RimI-like enzyme
MSIYLSAITLQAEKLVGDLEAFLARNSGYPQGVCDSWASLDLQGQGLRLEEEGEWYLREPVPLERVPDTEPDVIRVTNDEDLRQFEAASMEAFEMPFSVPTFSVHAPGILSDSRMGVFIGRVEGRVVTVGMAYASAGVVGIYGIATLPAYRRRGCGTVMTRAAINFAPDLPAVLQPSPLGAALYRRLGFRSIGRFRRWASRP